LTEGVIATSNNGGTGQGKKKTSVALLNMGGPDSLAAVQPFLKNLFSDPEILKFPLAGIFRGLLSSFIAKKRGPKVVENYRQIGGKSPLLDITMRQAAGLLQELGGEKAGYGVHVAMRYWRPRARQAAKEIATARGERVIILPLYPHFSKATSGSSIADFDIALKDEKLAQLPKRVIRCWFDFPPYIEALAEAVGEGLKACEGSTLLFSAHGLPERFIKEGDPYLDQIRATTAAVMERLPGVSHRLAFQSRVGPMRWIGPSVTETLAELVRDGVKKLLVVPVSFVSDHIETLHEIDIEYAATARSMGFEQFSRIPSLNTRPSFIKALASLVKAEEAKF